MDEKKIDETLYTRKCQNCGMVNSFVITKKGIETMANRLGYRKESDTAREILLWLKEHTFESGFLIIETHFKDRYGVDLTEDKEYYGKHC